MIFSSMKFHSSIFQIAHAISLLRNHGPQGEMEEFFKAQSPNTYYRLSSWTRASCEVTVKYKTHQIPTLKRFSYCLCDCLCRIPWSQMLSREWRCSWSSADRRCSVGAAPTGDAPTTSEWSTIVLPTKVRLLLEVLQYSQVNVTEELIRW